MNHCICNDSVLLFCIKCTYNHDAVYFDDKCINCGKISNIYYKCALANGCTNKLCFCYECSMNHHTTNTIISKRCIYYNTCSECN